VKIAESRRYSQLPENARRETTYTMFTPSRPGAFTTIAGSRSASAAESPSGSGMPSSGAPSLSRPRPEGWSNAASVAGTVRPPADFTSTAAASITRYPMVRT
jgi:hypothetical protein